MRIKAKMLLPLPATGEEEEEGDPREELVQRLVEYRQFKEAANTLRLREDERRLLFTRGMLPGEDEVGRLRLRAQLERIHVNDLSLLELEPIVAQPGDLNAFVL
jgi:chromatin segregation and condensation protein Rec8/ScpA/Scc1 (kleisin family)